MDKAYKSVVENQFKAFDNMLEGVSVYKLIFNDKGEAIDGKLEYMNQVTVETIDLNPDDAIGKNVVELFSSDYLNPIFQAINEFITTGKFKQLEMYYPPTDKYFLISGFNMSDDLFAVLRVDITERKKSEEQTELDRKRLETILETTPSAVIIVEADDGKISYINRRAMQLYGVDVSGLDLSDAISKVKAKRIDGSEYPVGEGPSARALKGEIIRNEEMIIEQPDGTVIPILASTAPIFNSEGKVIAAVAIFEDITERKQAEMKNMELLEEVQQFAEELEVSNEELHATTEELQVSNEELMHAHETLEKKVKERTAELEEALDESKEKSLKLDAIMDFAPDGITITGGPPDFPIETVSKRGLEMTGSPRSELLGLVSGKHQSAWNILHPDGTRPRKIEMPLYRSSRLGEVVNNMELVMKNVYGDIIPLVVSSAPIRDDEGNIIAAINIWHDITEIKQGEEQLKEAIEELKRSNAELESFAYITSHDLQEPLRSIASYAQLIERRYKGQLDSDADEFMDYMVGGATRLQAMIKGLLDYSRVGTKVGAFKDFNAEEALKYALSGLESSISECHVEVISDSLPVIHADENQISRVFQNLIGNALKFRKKDVQPKVHIKARKEGNEYIFSVQDNGIGIEPQYTDRIFEVFKRLHAIGEYQGAGIGLAIVKRIIERHGGRVWVESEFGVGSNFYFTIPRVSK